MGYHSKQEVVDFISEKIELAKQKQITLLSNPEELADRIQKQEDIISQGK